MQVHIVDIYIYIYIHYPPHILHLQIVQTQSVLRGKFHREGIYMICSCTNFQIGHTTVVYQTVFARLEQTSGQSPLDSFVQCI